jgi:hypothetical protein
MAKFNRPDDRWNYARVEYAMLRLARQCGINVSENRIETVGGQDVLLVKRYGPRLRSLIERRRKYSGRFHLSWIFLLATFTCDGYPPDLVYVFFLVPRSKVDEINSAGDCVALTTNFPTARADKAKILIERYLVRSEEEFKKL